MSSRRSLSETLVAVLQIAQDDLDKAEKDKANDVRVVWLERQLASMVSELQGYMLDIESGVSMPDLGFAEEEDFETMLDDLRAEITNLKAVVRSLKEIGR